MAGAEAIRATASWQAPDERIMLKAPKMMKATLPKNKTTVPPQAISMIPAQWRLHHVPPVRQAVEDTGGGSVATVSGRDWGYIDLCWG